MLVVPQTEVRLLNNVPLTSSYEHQMTFASKTAQSTYFTGKTAHTFSDFTYVKEDGTVKVPLGRDQLYACNYIMFKNTDFGTKWFYGFITKLEYVNPDTTKVHFELDVYQTWQFDFTFRQSYVEREHTQRFNGTVPVINTIDEGLAYGDEYETVHMQQVNSFDDIFFLVIACKQPMHTGSTGKVTPNFNGAPQPLTYYVHPFKLDGTYPTMMLGTQGLTVSPVADVLEALYEVEDAQNNIVSIYITEHFGIGLAKTDNLYVFPSDKFEAVQVGTFSTVHAYNVTDYSGNGKNLGNKYTGFYTSSESKLLMYPYCVTVLTDMKGNQIELKNEYIKGTDLTVFIRGSLGVSNKVAYTVPNYRVDVADDTNLFNSQFEHALINNSPNDLPVITDLLAAYLQGNRNTIENQKASMWFNAITTTIGGAVAGGAGMLGRGGIPGAVIGAGIGGGMAAANAHFTIEGLNAKQEDIANIPASISKMGGNTAFDFGHRLTGLFVIKKQITSEWRQRLEGYFKMFGYKVNMLKVPNLKTRQHYNFVKTVGANVTGNVPQEDLAVIKRMFDQGVTLWHGDWVGDYSLQNDEV